MAKKNDSAEAAETITVTAQTTLFEKGVTYHAGDAFETTPERAAALGENVTIPG